MSRLPKIRIYPESFAAITQLCAGQKYRPSNGTEGELFIDSWCGQCERNNDQACSIIPRTFAYDVDDPEYPTEWRYGNDGQPRCASYIEHGEKIPFKDEYTADLFAN